MIENLFPEWHYASRENSEKYALYGHVERIGIAVTQMSDGEADASGNKIKAMKRLFSCSTVSLSSASALVSCGLIFGSVAFGQGSASLSGRALDATGRPVANPVVRLVSDTTVQPGAHPLRYTLIGDSLGKFSQEGIAPGAYLVMLFTDGKAEKILQSVSLTPGTATVLEFKPGSPLAGRGVATSGTTLSMVGKGRPLAPTR